MRTRQQKNYRRNWFSRIDWENVGIGAIVVALIGGMAFGLGWVIVKDNSDKADSVPDTAAVVDTVVESSPEETKFYTTDFDTTMAGTRVVIKTNRRVKISIR